MNDFEFLAGFFGVLLGLIIAQLASKLADAIDAHEERPFGLLTGLMVAFVLTDVTCFWLWIWSARTAVVVSWTSVFGSTVLAIVYFLAASLIFPRQTARVRSYDEHYWLRKKLIFGAIFSVNAIVLAGQIARAVPALTDVWFFVTQGIYYVPLILLVFSRRRWLDIALLVWLLIQSLVVGFDALPHSQWGDDVGLNLDAKQHAAPPGPQRAR